MKRLVMWILIVALAGCETSDFHQAEPETYIFQAERSVVKSSVIEEFLSEGYNIVADSEFQLVMDKSPKLNMAQAILISNTLPATRVKFTFLGEMPVKVVTAIFVVENPGTGFEKTSAVFGASPLIKPVSEKMEEIMRDVNSNIVVQ